MYKRSFIFSPRMTLCRTSCSSRINRINNEWEVPSCVSIRIYISECWFVTSCVRSESAFVSVPVSSAWIVRASCLRWTLPATPNTTGEYTVHLFLTTNIQWIFNILCMYIVYGTSHFYVFFFFLNLVISSRWHHSAIVLSSSPDVIVPSRCCIIVYTL